jgi:hypothetical protein
VYFQWIRPVGQFDFTTGHVNKRQCKMELRGASRVDRGALIESKATGRSHQSSEIYATTTILFPPFPASIFWPSQETGILQSYSPYSMLINCKPNIRWVRLGCSLLTTLLSSPDGIRFLASEDDLLKQLVKCFAQLDPVCFYQLHHVVSFDNYISYSSTEHQNPTLYFPSSGFRRHWLMVISRCSEL